MRSRWNETLNGDFRVLTTMLLLYKYFQLNQIQNVGQCKETD